jgi:hypothetical protein
VEIVPVDQHRVEPFSPHSLGFFSVHTVLDVRRGWPKESRGGPNNRFRRGLGRSGSCGRRFSVSR